LDPSVEKAARFLDSLRTDERRTDFYEVAEPEHSEHRVYSQSQYLLSILLKRLGSEEYSRNIRGKHLAGEVDNDPTRSGHTANDRFCVLEDDTKPFYLSNQKDAETNDEIALLALYWLNKKVPILGNSLYRRNADRLYEKLRARFDTVRGVLEMDRADRMRQPRPLYPVYKIALLGILAKRMKDMATLNRVREVLRAWQHPSGGWVTDRTTELAPDGVANIETTALCTMALQD
jgi:hypothetical protein